MPRALLAGAFGQGNLGDEALLEAFVKAMPEWRVSVTVGAAGGTPSLAFDPVPARRRSEVARAAMAADAVVVGGGTIFKTLHASSRRFPHALLANASLLAGATSGRHRPFALIGVGAGDLPDLGSRVLSRYIVRQADLLILRDSDSADALVRAGLRGPFRTGADPAWSLVSPPKQSPAPCRGPIRIVPSRFAFHPREQDEAVGQLSRVLRTLLGRGHSVQVQSWQTSTPTMAGDDAIVADLVRRCGSAVEVVTTPSTFEEAIRSMTGLSALLSFRFHALIAAAAAGVRFVAVNHEAKLSSLARRLGQLSVGVDYEPVDLAERLERALDMPAPQPAAVKDQVDLAKEGFHLLEVLLSAGGSDQSDTLRALPLAPLPQHMRVPDDA